MTIPGYPPGATFRTIASREYEVPMCGSRETCPKQLGWRAHWFGRVDRYGTIHWKNADKRATKPGMRTFLKLMALNVHREWWAEPSWKRLYLTNVWATKEAKARYHFLIRARWSYSDRLLALKLVKRAGIRKTGSLRYKHRGFYKWLVDGGLVPKREVKSPEQVGVQED